MVVVAQKVGTLCIEYRPPETMSALTYDEGIFDSEDCSQYILVTKFYAGYVPFLPIYALDPRCFSRLRIRCYSIFDALDFVHHLDLKEFDFKFVPETIELSESARKELSVIKAECKGTFRNGWLVRLHVAEQSEPLVLSSYEHGAGEFADLEQVFPISNDGY